MRDRSPWSAVTTDPPTPESVISGGRLRSELHETATPLPEHELRVRVCLDDWPRGDIHVTGAAFTGLEADTSQAVFAHGAAIHGLVGARRDGTVAVALEDDSPAWLDPRLLELILLARRSARDTEKPPILGVALLGYGAIGAEHAAAVSATQGLRLIGVADRDPSRVASALESWSEARAYESADDLLADPAVDVVIVSTPPDSHARWATEALQAGKHVVVEKPMALTSAECDALLETGQRLGLTVSVYQNRRFDPDYRLIKRTVSSGSIGDVFHLEAFVGGYGHPCNYWHSDAAVSGGALFDWGSHIVDQVLDLMPGDVDFVTGVNHKRVWHDVTNADHARMTLTFAGGEEATFVYSDIAAALKPRWFILGTRGAITGEWRDASVVRRSAIGTLDEDVLAPADSPPRIRVHSPEGHESLLASPVPEAHPFHADLALALRYGLTPRVRGEQSRRVVAMLQAAEESAALGGIPVKPT